MSLEGLKVILEKEEIVVTQRAGDLIDRPEIVAETYQRHVRTYIPLGRQAENDDNGQSVTGLEKRIIREIKQGGAVRGYITGEFGHGKTSTALYLWERARSANLLAVPPFQLNRLSDIINAVFGWARYEIGRTRPNLVAELDPFYQSLVQRDAESLAERLNIGLDEARRVAQYRPDLMELTAADYILFFEQMTQAAQSAGYDGLIVIADEVQQYIEPEIKSGVRDPISPLFDIIQVVMTRQKYLNFGLMLIIPPKELGVLREQRGDLVHRILQVGLDLRTIYDRSFPSRLWRRLAEEFDFTEHNERVFSPHALDALGQIASRLDLSDGPRTVVNVFRRAVRRYIEGGYPPDDPYTPYHLSKDFLDGAIQFDSSKKIPQTISQAISHNSVRGYPERERAVMWAAAFPIDGVRRSIQESCGLSQAFDDLARSSWSDLIISVGNVKDPGITLRGLDAVPIETRWLPLTLREFARSYYETADATRRRALKGFTSLLRQKVFPESQWKIMETIPEGLTRNLGIVFEGAASSYARRFPERQIHVRILWEDEQVKDDPRGDIVIQIRLREYLDKPEEIRRHINTPLKIDVTNHLVEFTINLMARGEGKISSNLEKELNPVVSPYKLTPLLLLAIYGLLEEKRSENLIPREEDEQFVQFGFQPELLDNAFRAIFNAQVGKPVEASEERIVELACQYLFEAIYPNYDTLIRVGNWSSSIQKYQNAIKHLETTHERQGQISFEGTKDEVAALFTLSNTGLDSFITNFPALIEVIRDFPTRKEIEQGNKAAVRFKLHPLEQQIKTWITEAPDSEKISQGGQQHIVRRMLTSEIYHRAMPLGYREKEVDALLDLMESRGLVDRDIRRGFIRQAINQAPSLDELVSEIQQWQSDLQIFSGAFSSPQLKIWQEEAEKARRMVDDQLRSKPDDEKAIRLRRSVQQYRQLLTHFADEKHQQLRQEISRLISHLPTSDTRQQQTLEAPVQGQVEYVTQVNDLRNRLLREFTAFTGELDRFRRSVRTIETDLKAEVISYQSLVELAKNLKDLIHKCETLQNKRNAITARFNHYTQWARLVERGSALLQEIQTLGDLVKPDKERFFKLSRIINGEISAHKLDVLSQASSFELQLDEIGSAVRSLRTEAENVFIARQESYQRALVRVLEFPPERLWKAHRFNPLAPDDSQDRLYTEVIDALIAFLEQMNRRVTKEQEAVRATVRSPLLSSLHPETRETIATRGCQLEADLSRIAQQLIEVSKMITVSVIADYPTEGEGQFHRLLQQLNGCLEVLKRDLKPRVEALSRELQLLELTGPEELLLKTLASENQAVDLTKLRQTVPRLSENEFWTALRGLHAKRRTTILLEVVQYE